MFASVSTIVLILGILAATAIAVATAIASMRASARLHSEAETNLQEAAQHAAARRDSIEVGMGSPIAALSDAVATIEHRAAASVADRAVPRSAARADALSTMSGVADRVRDVNGDFSRVRVEMNDVRAGLENLEAGGSASLRDASRNLERNEFEARTASLRAGAANERQRAEHDVDMLRSELARVSDQLDHAEAGISRFSA